MNDRPVELPLIRTRMYIDYFSGLMLVIIGFAGVVTFKFNGGDIEFLIVSMAALTTGLGLLAAGSVRKDLHEHMTSTENQHKR